ncbi:MAG: L-lysine 6-transaminase, partial [Thermovenabulum sp.]
MFSPHDVIPTLEKYILVDGYPLIVDLENSFGSYIVDARDGTEYLDFYTFFASSPLGLNHPKLANEEFKERVF